MILLENMGMEPSTNKIKKNSYCFFAGICA